jgi:hypothetical protein
MPAIFTMFSLVSARRGNRFLVNFRVDVIGLTLVSADLSSDRADSTAKLQAISGLVRISVVSPAANIQYHPSVRTDQVSENDRRPGFWIVVRRSLLTNT